MSDSANKLTNSAHQLGVMLGIPMYVDPEKGFESEKVLTWENGDKVKVKALWSDGAFYYTAYLGQIDPKTNEMSYISGEIANANSLESLIGMIDGFLKEKAVERGETETVVNPEVLEPVAVEPETAEPEITADAPVVVDTEPVAVIIPTDDEAASPEDAPAISAEGDEGEPIPALDPIDQYKALSKEYQDLITDPDHDHNAVWEVSQKLRAVETKLREQGIMPAYII